MVCKGNIHEPFTLTYLLTTTLLISNLTFFSSAWLSLLDLQPMGHNTTDARLCSSNPSNSSTFFGSNPSIGQASILFMAHASSRKTRLIYTWFFDHASVCSAVKAFLNPRIVSS